MRLILLLTAFIIAVATTSSVKTAASPPPPLPPSPPVSYHKVAFQWPMALCLINRCRKQPPKAFRLHGIWPTGASGVEIYNCSGAPSFKPEDLPAPLRNSLLAVWPSFLISEDGFWQHEWNTHGTCSHLEPLDYFGKGVNLAKTYFPSIFNAFTRQGINPGPEETYTPEKYSNALVAYLRATPQLRCETHNGDIYLLEIRLCFTLNFQLQNCPTQGWLSGCGPYREQNSTKVIFYVDPDRI